MFPDHPSPQNDNTLSVLFLHPFNSPAPPFSEEYAGDLCINILRRKGYRTQTTTHNPTKKARSHTRKKRKKKIPSEM
jgi:hypothetical protein